MHLGNFCVGAIADYFCRLPICTFAYHFSYFAFLPGYGILAESILEDTSMRQLQPMSRIEALPRRVYRGSGWTMSAHSA
jgi:hypothetical protein